MGLMENRNKKRPLEVEKVLLSWNATAYNVAVAHSWTDASSKLASHIGIVTHVTPGKFLLVVRFERYMIRSNGPRYVCEVWKEGDRRCASFVRFYTKKQVEKWYRDTSWELYKEHVDGK